mmetsp:Transcript_7315/g.31096  ORF Transcript_7315/g.31096 Transcript_7315/m.31096 type:complete len:243 (+) Transcript_7315:114-842(+)|eukprot:CAMPEP_0114612442 /NCGR_PEP_ID=MMETSP0168-20121206/4625_1 /TAXON_ID=95228 ORGANISM="Vannella sp., Strain DIVA3 517/6/12" /NCGR_SAMPLE_ID=MMETSP0168 /ASSEMBLY_ACC=CAM_ASM_000044 /LENGTH=242 /DNA_ID=CAMNT_0001823429 /DNA_START=91 /DNA_END=819 /DNA_ORIENTATION=+
MQWTSFAALLALALCCLAVGTEAKCAGIFPPFVPLPTSSFNYRQMDTCCWYAENTCCGVHDELFDLSAIEAQIEDLASRGLSDQCYIKLTNLMCFWCDPNTVDFVSVPTDSANPTSLLLLCESFCNELFIKCFDDLPRLVNDVSQLNSATEFCEHIILDNFHNDDDDIFPDVRIRVVGDNESGSCFEGVDDDEVEREGDVCIPLNSGEEDDIEPIVYLTISSASIISFSAFATLLGAAVFML